MCGIAGYIGPQTPKEQAIRSTLVKMRRRGPDGEGARVFKNSEIGQTVALLHSRLAIIDLDKRAGQPFKLKKKWLIFNGELYNYLELRKALEAKGRKFITKSDTEVFIHVLDEWGFAGLEQCEGMWAFALFNEADGSLSVSRDRFGEKPLYLYIDSHQGVYFASEVKGIRALSGKEFTLNTDHLYRFLVNGYKSVFKQPTTFFNGIEPVPAGSIITFGTDGSKQSIRYWAPKYNIDQDMSYEDAVKGARERLLRSVELRLRADVPLAFCMSGGVDSNSLISIAKRELGYDVHGFTIVNTDKRYEEQDLVNLVRDELKIKHTSIGLNSQNFLGRLRRLVKYHDAPVYTVSYYVHWLLQKEMANQNYKISISGTAADELHSGYFDHQSFYLYDMHRDGINFEESVANWQREIGPIVRNPFLQDPKVFIKNPFERRHIYLDAEIFKDFLVKDWYEPFFEKMYRYDSVLKNRMLNEIFHEATPLILHEDDMNAMYYSIENRSPFLDRDLFEFCNSIPTKYLIQGGAAKSVLRESMRGIVPNAVLDSKKKVGFNAPINDLLNLEDEVTRNELLADSPIFEHVKYDMIEDLINTRNAPNSKSKFLFSFLSCKMFLEEHF